MFSLFKVLVTNEVGLVFTEDGFKILVVHDLPTDLQIQLKAA